LSVLLDVNPWGAVETMSFDHATGNLTIARTTDIQAILDNNAELANGGFDKKSEMWPIASMPLEVLYDWMLEYQRESGRHIGDPFSNDEDFNSWCFGRLDSSEYLKFRTGHFRIGR